MHPKNFLHLINFPLFSILEFPRRNYYGPRSGKVVPPAVRRSPLIADYPAARPSPLTADCPAVRLSPLTADYPAARPSPLTADCLAVRPSPLTADYPAVRPSPLTADYLAVRQPLPILHCCRLAGRPVLQILHEFRLAGRFRLYRTPDCHFRRLAGRDEANLLRLLLAILQAFCDL
jgi:hypothetical protein